MTPINKVMAKPLTIPEVFKKLKLKGLIKTRAVMMVARLASLIESQARPKPSSRATEKGRSILNSSLSLSKIKMLLSTAMPTERIKPAMPGRVRVTGISL